MPTSSVASFLIALVAVACSEPAGGAADGGPRDAAGDAAGDDPLFERAPAFVEVLSRGDFAGTPFDTYFHAELRDGAQPTLHVETQREGACRMLEAVRPQCAPACGADALCTATDTCTPFRSSRSAGALTVASAGETFALTASVAGYDRYEGSAVLTEDDEVSASATGGEHPGFSVAAAWPPALVMTQPDSPVAGASFTLRWTPADPDTRFALTLRTDLGHGPWPPVQIECDVADAAGELTIPAAMIDAFVDPSAWGCGDCFGSWAGRVARAVEPGGVELRLERRVDLYLYPF